jgi:hypothetical protein
MEVTMSPKGVKADVEERSERASEPDGELQEESAPAAESDGAAEEPFEELALLEIEVNGEEIAIRAYEIHLSGPGGDHVENWLRAEQELVAERRGRVAVVVAPGLEGDEPE